MHNRIINPRLSITLFVFVLILAILACNMPGSSEPTSVVNAVSTSVAQTAAAMLTTSPVAPTVRVPTIGPATATNLPPPPPTTPPTATPIPCNRVEFVSDVSYPDNTAVLAGTSFTKTWRLKNTGSCTWTTGYQIIFDKGDRMSAPDAVPVTTGSIGPGSTADTSVNLIAPVSPGTYRGNYLLRAPDGTRFGIGAGGSGNFWVQIVVPSPTATATSTATPTVTPTTGLALLPIKTLIIINP
jgi:hypothetical protein